jgi:hypothetical protein
MVATSTLTWLTCDMSRYWRDSVTDLVAHDYALGNVA